jgi:transcriptional regulator GlxA family with amidase domain
LLSRVRHVETKDKIAAAANYLFRIQGDISIANLALPEEIGLRQFERRFQSETGLSPKVSARYLFSWRNISTTTGFLHSLLERNTLAFQTPE